MENQNLEILLVEDNAADAELTLRALKKYNFANNILHLKDGAEALEFIFGTGKFQNRSLILKPKLIILDLKMPKVDGIEVLRKVKSEEQTKMIPVVVLSSSKESPDIQVCYDLGANSFIVKPVEFDNYINSVSELGNYWLQLNQAPK